MNATEAKWELRVREGAILGKVPEDFNNFSVPKYITLHKIN